jgi:hypothetical protein
VGAVGADGGGSIETDGEDVPPSSPRQAPAPTKVEGLPPEQDRGANPDRY